jgi:hypothetical protein
MTGTAGTESRVTGGRLSPALPPDSGYPRPVFECHLKESQIDRLRLGLLAHLDRQEDSVYIL